MSKNEFKQKYRYFRITKKDPLIESFRCVADPLAIREWSLKLGSKLKTLIKIYPLTL